MPVSARAVVGRSGLPSDRPLILNMQTGKGLILLLSGITDVDSPFLFFSFFFFLPLCGFVSVCLCHRSLLSCLFTVWSLNLRHSSRTNKQIPCLKLMTYSDPLSWTAQNCQHSVKLYISVKSYSTIFYHANKVQTIKFHAWLVALL